MTLLADTTFANAQDLAARCARRTMNTWHVLDDRGHYLIADDADAAAWGDRIVWSIEPEMCYSAAEMDPPPFDDPLPDDGPGQDIDGVPYPRCKNLDCAGLHFTWQCPQIRALLFAEPLAMVLNVEYAPVGWAA